MAPVKKIVTAAPGSQPSNALKFFNDESPGIQLAPSSVLVLALAYVGTVVVFHIMSKIFGGSPKVPAADTETATPASEPHSEL